jgi:hypothetical protein
MLLFFNANRKRGSRDDENDLATSNLYRNKTETVHSNAGQNNSAANMNTYTTTLQIIIDFPSYKQNKVINSLTKSVRYTHLLE